MTATLRNFGRNVRFSPRLHYSPATEAEVLEILDRHRSGRIRPIGSLHSWSDVAASDDVSVDLRRFDAVAVERSEAGVPGTARAAGAGVYRGDAGSGGAVRVARVGGGCTIARIVRTLRVQAGLALPSLGGITRQTIAGATATGTHGSGSPSMSDLVESVRVAAYDADGRAAMYEWRDGDELLAARCAIGCAGIVTELRVRCVPVWDVEERFVARQTLDAVLAQEADFPLQMFLLLPFVWSFLVYQRRHAPAGATRSAAAPLYRAYNRVYVDGGMHGLMRLVALRGGGERRVLRRLLDVGLPRAFVRGWRVTDRYDRLLTLRHDWFRHEEMELSVPAQHVHEAAAVVRAVTERCARRGSYTHLYPVLFRRVLPDRTLLSVTGGETEPWYAISLFSYAPPGRRAGFRAFAATLARTLADTCGARPHWGKHFPLGADDVGRLYDSDRFARFRAVCAAVDPAGVFRNEFTRRVLGL